MRERFMRVLLSMVFMASVAMVPVTASAQTQLDLGVSVSASCDAATFNLEVLGGSGSYDVTVVYGDGEDGLESISGTTAEFNHTYPSAGTYEWSFMVTDSADATISGMATGTLEVGPQVTLTSDIFPPVLTLEGGSAALNFTAEVTGAVPPVTYAWDLDGDGSVDPGADASSNTASFEYSQAGKYSASVEVTDNCGLPASDSLPVVVFDPEDACHPRAQEIAEAVSSLFPGQSNDTYSCEDIFGIFNGDLTGDQLGFGRMWHAYQLSESLEELTWEEILDWHLNQGGWGLLTQLDRYSEALTEIGLRDLTQMIVSGEATINEVRTAVRSVVKHEADFEDALTRLQDGASPGELGQFYRLASDLELDPTALDAYLDEGMSLPEIKHLGSLAERFEADLEELALARQEGAGWGDLNQAYRLADEETSAAEILSMGVKEYRQSQREQDRSDRELERQERTANRLAEQYNFEFGDVMSMYEGCEQDWSCVRSQLRDQTQTQQQSQQANKDDRTAARLAGQYGVPESQVWGVFNGECSGDWGCVRQALKGENPRGGGKKNK